MRILESSKHHIFLDYIRSVTARGAKSLPVKILTVNAIDHQMNTWRSQRNAVPKNP